MDADTVQPDNQNIGADLSNAPSIGTTPAPITNIDPGSVGGTSTLVSNAGSVSDTDQAQLLFKALEALISSTLNGTDTLDTRTGTAAPRDRNILKAIKANWKAMSQSKIWQSNTSIGLVRWLCFSVFIALMPIILVIFSLTLHKITVNFETTISHGELLLVSIAILGDITGDLVLNKQISPTLKALLVGINLFIFGVACYLFADILRTLAAPKSDNISIDINAIALYSFSILAWTLVAGILSKVKATKE